MKKDLGLKNPGSLPALVLAYIGDAVYELYVRKYLVASGFVKVDALHKQAVKFVNAATQARMLHALAEKLSEDEAAVVRRGRNAKSGSAPKNISMINYRHGTAFESLIGYLYLAGREDRIEEIFEIGRSIILSAEEGEK